MEPNPPPPPSPSPPSSPPSPSPTASPPLGLPRLPIELIEPVVITLNAKTLVSLAAVSKTYNALIMSDPHFLKLYHSYLLKHRLHPSSLIFNPSSERHPHLFVQLPLLDSIPSASIGSDSHLISSFSFLDAPDVRLSILDSRMGVLLLKGVKRVKTGFIEDLGLHCYSEEFFYYICNPSVGKFHMFQVPEDDSASYDNYMMLLVDESPQSFKVLSLKKDYESDERKLVMYSFLTGEWIHLGITIEVGFTDSLCYRYASYFQGRIFWPGDVNGLYFDFEKMSTHPFPMPNNMDAYFFFGESGGHLHTVIRKPLNALYAFDVMEMKEDFTGWLCKFHLDFTPIAHTITNPLYLENPSISCVVRQQNEKESFLVCCLDDYQLMAYYLQDGNFNFVPLFKSEDHHFGKVIQHNASVLWIP